VIGVLKCARAHVRAEGAIGAEVKYTTIGTPVPQAEHVEYSSFNYGATAARLAFRPSCCFEPRAEVRDGHAAVAADLRVGGHEAKMTPCARGG
jgi:hypothetical protein